MSVAIRGLAHAYLGGLAPVDGNVSPTNTMNAIFGEGKWAPNKAKLALVKFTGGKDVDSQQLFVESIPTSGKVAAVAAVGLVGVIGYVLGKR